MVFPKAARCCTYCVAYMSAPSANPMPARHDGSHGVEPSMAKRTRDFADHILGRDAHVGQDELSGIDAFDAHFVVGASNVDAWPFPLDNERRDGVVGSTGWSSPVLAKTVYQFASRTPDIQHLVPLRTQSSPSRTPRVRMPIRRCQLALRTNRSGSQGALSNAGQILGFLASVPAIMTGPVGRRVSKSIRAAVLEYFATSSMAMARPKIRRPSHRTRPADRVEQASVSKGLKDGVGYVPSLSIWRPVLDFVLSNRRTDI